MLLPQPNYFNFWADYDYLIMNALSIYAILLVYLCESQSTYPRAIFCTTLAIASRYERSFGV